ncbi:MAG: hypothetical protein VB074_02280 [Proteiniphilum sp.]|uniref:hypothetical protein n=1 Tax=Proteiniphilum sp. TaxID=1926877 RepID=UPI002B1F3819|nr:hypothetical protein [Proteiniphilum sp.]MEA5126988.1 hypothetical protein [Proteiniphilum sp.]
MNTVNKQIISHFLPIIIILLAVYSVLPYTRTGVPMVASLNNTTLWWGISLIILIAFFLSRYYFFDKRNEDNMLIVWMYLLWNLVSIIRGVFVAEIYWDWKALIGNTMALMLPIVIFSATNKMVVQSLLAFFIKYALPLFLVSILIIRTDAYGFYLIPVSFLVLFFPALTKRQKMLLLFISAIVIVADLSARSNVIKFGVPFFVLLLYKFRKVISVKIMEILRIAIFVIPLILFILGVTGTFNVFNMDEYIKGDITVVGMDNYGDRVEQKMTTDTRTFLYKEVLESAINNNYWLLGRTPARGNDSDSFGYLTAELTGRYERISNEIGLANVFTWTGIIGVVLFSLIFFRASYLAVNRSKSIYAKMLGIYVAFRWLYSWIEDVNDFSLNYFMLMVMIGLCFSESFRNMTNKDITIWVRGIFDVRYVRLQQYLYKKNKYAKTEYSSLANVPQPEK